MRKLILGASLALSLALAGCNSGKFPDTADTDPARTGSPTPSAVSTPVGGSTAGQATSP